jgi:APA family basic amino acid/polyamine antiporter
MIGAGIFTTSGIVAAQLPDSGWVILCWVFGGLIAISGALCYGELSTRMPEEGAEYVYLKKLYHPALGFLTGWTSFLVGFSAAIAASALACTEYLYAGLGDKFAAIDPAQLLLIKKGTAAAVILVLTILHYLGLRVGSGVQNVLTIVKILIVAGLAVSGLILGGESARQISFSTSGTHGGGIAVGTAMLLVMFAYSGWNGTAYIAGEIKNPRRTLPVSLLAGTVIVIVLYLALNLFIFRSLSYGEAEGVIAIVEKASVNTFGAWMGKTLSLLVAIALLSSLSAYVMIGPRVYFAMARDRLFFPFASRVHPRYRVPGWSIVIQGGVAVLMIVVGSFEQLLIYLGFALGIFPWLAIAGLFISRRRGIGDGTAVKAWGYPVVPLFFLASTLALLIIAFINRPVESGAAIFTILLGIPCYLLWVRGMKARV